MNGYLGCVLLLAVGTGLVALAYALHAVVGLSRVPVRSLPSQGGAAPTEHAWSRYHARWYVAAMVFLAFDIEMLFMYPWAVVLPQTGGGAVVEMFGFLSVVLAGVFYARREGVFRWS